MGQVQRAFVIQHVHVVDVHQGQRARGGAGGHDDVLAFNRGFCAFVIHFQLPEVAVFAHKGSGAEQAGYFIFLKQEFNPAGELGDDGVFTLDHLGGVKLHITHGDAVFGKVVLRGMEMLGRLQQGFGRDAAHIQAGAAQSGGVAGLVHAGIDTGGFETQLCGADGGNITAGAGADDHYVELRHIEAPFV